MIWTPDRLAGLIEGIEKGEPIDTSRLATLLTLDLARAGEQLAIAAVKQQEAADDQLARLGD